ncbi:hypothetical protein [Cryobacterium sp. TMT4-10]|uniref:hypothetical protein n=1 Tax=Cryobacterium sp. TMT4-10 TaxID=1259256 RepID=UPI00106D5DD6|nr:hypothetical protein [Cryobacterium sp. TMT4-10]TFD13137.1 hypothetical protein E3T42_14295 [Cryobacterium sp. TMT4-10]
MTAKNSFPIAAPSEAATASQTTKSKKFSVRLRTYRWWFLGAAILLCLAAGKRPGEIMKKSAWGRVLGILTSAVVLGATLTSCAPADLPDGSVRVKAGTPATLTVDDIRVELAKDSISGSGELSIAPIEVNGKHGFDISLSGDANLVGEATITFTGTPQEGEPAPLVSYIDDAGILQPVDVVTLVGNEASVVTTHFSNWFTDWWHDLTDPITRIWSGVFSPLPTDLALACKETDALLAGGHRTNGPHEDDQRGSWCAGIRDTRPELKIKNARGYPMVVEATGNLVLNDEDRSLENAYTQLFAILGSQAKTGNSIYALSGYDAASYTVAGDSLQGVYMSGSPSAYVGEALRFAADTYMFLAEVQGKKIRSKDALDALTNTGCIGGFGKMAGANPATVTAVTEYIKTAVGTSIDCLGPAMEYYFKGDAWLVRLVAGVKWIVDGVSLASQVGPAIGDMLTNLNNPYIVTITDAPEPSVAGLPAELSGEWCTRSKPSDCFSGTQTLKKWPDAFVESVEQATDAPGATSYGICIKDEGNHSCSMAATMILQYFPAGVAWDCTAMLVSVEGQGWPSCEPDYTSAHDTDLPRLTHMYNHQQDVVYHDVEPMYQVD